MLPETAPPPEKAGKRERNKAANRASILEAARECFLTNGYEGVTIRDVIRKTGLAAGTFYNYFPDKESLFRELVESRIQAMTNRLTEVRRQAADLEAFVHGAYLAAFEAVAEDPVLHTLLLRNEAVIRSLYDDSVMGISVRAMKSDISDAIERGLMPSVNVEFLAATFYGAGYEMSRLIADNPEQHCPEQAARFAAAVFLRGIGGAVALQQTEAVSKPGR